MPQEDYAREWTDNELESLEWRIQREYQQAAREMRGKQAKWLERFEREKEQREKALDNTDEAMAAHKKWLQSQAARSEWLGGMADKLAQSAHQANVRAIDMVNNHLPRIYAENANMAAFSVDKMLRADTSFTLVNEDAVRYLMGIRTEGADPTQLIRETPWFMAQDGRERLQDVRKREIDAAKDIRWNRQKFTSAIIQGILQGESIPSIVRRTREIFGQNSNAAIRAARTATTNAENAGRMNSFERAQRLGIDMEIEWLATLVGRTRPSHRALDGERIHTGERFSNGLRWPGDPEGRGSEVWNCRCRANGRVVGFDGKRGEWADDARGERWARLPEGMTYEQWKLAKSVTRGKSYENEAGRVAGGWYGGRAGVANQEGNVIIEAVANGNAKIWQAAGADVYEHGAELLSKADQLTAKVWRKYEDDMTLHKADGRRGFYRPGEGVTMNVAEDMADPKGRGRLSTWFHEFGHHIDGLAAGRDWAWYSRNAGFADTLTKEVQDYINSVHKQLKAAHKAALKALDADDLIPAIEWLENNSSLSHLPRMYREALEHLDDEAWFINEGYPPYKMKTRADRLAFLKEDIKGKVQNTKPLKSKAYAQVENEIRELSTAEKHSLSDIFEGATKGKVQAGWGHGKGYWTKHGDYLSLEAFAEFYSAECVYAETPQTLDALRRFLPKSYAKYREILGEVAEL